MKTLVQCGLFDDFKPDTTLLLWCERAESLAALSAALDQMAQGGRTSILIDDEVNARAVDETQVRFERSGEDAVLLEVAGAGRLVRLRCSAPRCAELRDQLRSFGEPPERPDHHYLEISPDQPIQIIVSVAEYPPDLRP